MELVLIRHGEIDANVKNVCLGKTDIPMSSKGLRQMQTLSRVFCNDMVTAIYSSPLKSAVSSADAINKYHNLPIETLEGLSERDYGVWENKSFSDIEENHKEEYEMWLSDWQNYEIPLGESAKQAQTRNIDAIKKIIADNPNGKVIVVSHEGVIKNIIAHLLQMEPQGTWHFKVNNAAITRFEIDEDGYATILSFNEI